MRKNMLLLTFSVIPMVSHALSYSTPERSFLRQVSVLLETHKKQHGEYPKNWNELNKIYGDSHYSLDDTFDYIQPSDTYRFVTEDLTLPLYDDEEHYCKALLISNGPIRNITMHMGTFGIYKKITESKYFALVIAPKDEFYTVHLSPQTVQSRYEAAGLTMPEPIEVPERIWVKKAKKEITFRYTLYASPILIVVILAYRRIRKHNQSRLDNA